MMLRPHLIVMIYQLFSSVTAEPLRGSNIQPANLPFIASLAFKLPDHVLTRYHFCTGSLITRILVLTAAHCLKDRKYDQVDVVIGAADLEGAQPKYDVKWWIVFDEWAMSKKPSLVRLQLNDIAVVRLQTPVEQPDLTLAHIAGSIAKLHDKSARLIGWVKGPEDVAGRYLQSANVQILTLEDCAHRFQLISNKTVVMSEGVLCTAADPFVLMTEGDSGAPLLDDNNEILGINRSLCPKSAYNCTEEFADQNRYTVHTDLIPEYRRFIDAYSKRCS